MIGELKQEAGSTRKVLERVPEDKLSWRPHAKSMSLGELALHIAAIPLRIADLLSEPAGEIPNVPRPEAKSQAELLSTLDASLAHATAKYQAWGDQGLDEIVRLTRNGQTLFEQPRVNLLRTVMLNHWYHHRGQLTVYLRLLDVPLPAVYGSSADEKPF
jgi:uncharacterized damage-inducible protein DinB